MRREEVCAAIGCSFATLRDYEMDRSMPNVVMLVRLARLYEVPIEALLVPAEVA
jgi:transcriptional regulator with XRE-family HTH domain